MTELSRQSSGGDEFVSPALQRYVIAWDERERAARALTSAAQTLAAEHYAALTALQKHVSERVRVPVQLLGGRHVEVFYDGAGIVVLDG